MSVSENWWILLVIGMLSGVLSGTFGVGAGIIMIPALVFLAVPQKEAQAVALAVMVPMALLGVWRYHANPEIHVNLGLAGWIALGSVAGVMLGTHFAGVLTGTTLRRLFALVMAGVAVRMWFTK